MMRKPKLVRITTVAGSFGLLKGQLEFMAAYFEVTAISTAGSRLEELGQHANIAIRPLSMTRKLSPIQDLIAVIKLYFILRKLKPDIVHTHTPKAGTVGMLAAKLAGVPYRLHTVAGLPLIIIHGWKRLLLDVVEKFTYHCATGIYPNSFGLKEIILTNRYVHSDKVKVIGNGSSNGINTAIFNRDLVALQQIDELKLNLGINRDDFVYLYVGRIVAAKGINELVRAFELLNKKHPKTKLVLVGSFERQLDSLSSETEFLIDQHPCILSVGYQNDVRPYFALADVFTFPTYREGFPNVLMQSCSMQVASIATNINGCNEIIRDGYNGILIQPRNQQQLEDAMIKLLLNPELRREYSSNCRIGIVEKYDQQFVWGEILKEYFNVLK